MSSFTSHFSRKQTFYAQEVQKVAPLEKIAVVVSVAAIAAFIVIDVIRTAPADAAPVAVTFDVAPQTQWATTAPAAETRWAADDSARGTRPDSVH